MNGGEVISGVNFMLGKNIIYQKDSHFIEVNILTSSLPTSICEVY